MDRGGRSVTRRCGCVVAMLCVAGLVATSSAWATASLSVESGLGSGLTVGKQGLQGSVTVTNTSTSPHNKGAGAIVLASITLVPSCGQPVLAADCPVAFRDPAAFSLNPNAIGAAGTACAGTPFTVTKSDAEQGKFQFVPTGLVSLSIGVPAKSPSCQVAFTFDVARMPGFDADPASTGVQSGRIAFASGTHTTDQSPAVTIRPDISGTIFPSAVTLSGSIDGGLVNTPLTDKVTLTGAPTAPGLTGTMTFKLHAPGDPSCAGAPVSTSSLPVSGSGAYASEPFIPTATGTYRWTASYSGDTNNAAASTACGDRSQTVAVASAVVVTGPASRVGRIGATMTGSVNTGGGPTTYVFEYGPTTAYGQQTAVQPVSAGAGAIPVAAMVSSLRAGTTYHYRLVATNAGGSLAGADGRFKTKPKAAPKRLSVAVSPRSDASPPFRFTVRGKLVLPTSVAPSQGCKGLVSIRVTYGKRTVASGRAGLDKRCNYAKRLTVPRSGGGTRKLKLTVSFFANRVLRGRSGETAIRTG